MQRVRRLSSNDNSHADIRKSSQVGDRLIPVGYTSSRNAAAHNGDLGPILTTAEEEALVSATRAGRRSGRRGGSTSDGAAVPPGDLEEVSKAAAVDSIVMTTQQHITLTNSS